MKLRLLLTAKCNRNCEGCCNKDYDLAALPVCTSYAGYDEILITGGEPLLFPILLVSTIEEIRKQTTAPVYVYTAYRNHPEYVFNLLHDHVDGITLTLHEQADVRAFFELNWRIQDAGLRNKSLRLNVFKGITLPPVDLSLWKIKHDMEWIQDCPIPADEVFMRAR